MKCIIVDDEELSRNTLKHFVEKTDFLELVAVCPNAIEANNLLAKEDIDLMFLDVSMPELTGIEFIKSLDNPPLVILVTSSTEHAVEAFEYNVLDYLVKPAEYARFLKAVNKAKEKYEAIQVGNENSNEIFVKSDFKIVRINLDDVLFVEALADYVIINTVNGKYIVHSTMKGMESKLPNNKFIRVHRSYIVNLNRIDSIEDSCVVITKKIIPIGASHKDGLMARLKFLL